MPAAGTGGAPAQAPVRAAIKLTYRCNSRCLFCRVDQYRGRVADVPAPEVVRKVMAARELGVGMVLFSGGEPTMREDLPALARAVAALGMRFGLITNGRRLSYRPYREALLDLGLAYVHTSLHGARAATHDAHVRCCAFGEVLAALEGIAGRGVEVHVNTVITRLDVGELADTSDLLARFAPLTHKLCLMEPRGSFEDHEARLAIPPEEAGSAAVACVERSRGLHREAGLETVVEGFPTCQVEAARDAVASLRTHNILYMSEAFEDRLFPTDDGERTYLDPCWPCAARPDCPGVYVGYAERYGTTGLRTLRRAPA